MTLQDMLGHLQDVRPVGNGYLARCPAHDDDKPSLSVTQSNGRILLKCHAGCSFEAIRDALGLTNANLRTEPPGQRRIVASYDYQDEAGALLYQVLRFQPKDFRQRRPDGRGGWAWNMKGVRRVLYRLPELVAAGPERTVCIVEGEKAADRLASVGLLATCSPGGAGKWRPEYAESLRGRHVVVLPDNDPPGRDHARDVARSLTGVAASVRVLELPGLAAKADVYDWLEAGHTAVDLERLASQAPEWQPDPAVAATQPQEALQKDYGPAGELVSPRLAGASSVDLAHLTDLGNCKRLVMAHGHDLRYVPQWGWLAWDGQRWQRDADGQVMRCAKEVVLTLYAEAMEELRQAQKAIAIRQEQVARGQAGPDDAADDRLKKAFVKAKALLSWAEKSQSRQRLEAMVALAATEVEVVAHVGDFDADPWLFNCANGTLDLKTGHLREHRREDLCTRLAPVDYDPDAAHPMWDSFLATATGGDSDLAAYLQRAAGYSLTGMAGEENVFLVLGPTATGKTTFTEVLLAALGDYGLKVAFDTFLERDKRSVGAPRPDLAALFGVRLVAACESSDSQKLDPVVLKQVSGGDTISARHLYREQFSFKPRCKVWLATNELPRIPDQDDAVWRRLRRLPFEQVIPEAERDPAVKATLTSDPEALSAALAWAVRGCLAWQREGLGYPAIIREKTVQLRISFDPLVEFFADCCLFQPSVWTEARVLRQAYEQWADQCGARPINNREWGQRLEAKQCVKGKRHLEGRQVKVWYGVGLLTAESGTDGTDKRHFAESSQNQNRLSYGEVYAKTPFVGTIGTACAREVPF